MSRGWENLERIFPIPVGEYSRRSLQEMALAAKKGNLLAAAHLKKLGMTIPDFPIKEGLAHQMSQTLLGEILVEEEERKGFPSARVEKLLHLSTQMEGWARGIRIYSGHPRYTPFHERVAVEFLMESHRLKREAREEIKPLFESLSNPPKLRIFSVWEKNPRSGGSVWVRTDKVRGKERHPYYVKKIEALARQAELPEEEKGDGISRWVDLSQRDFSVEYGEFPEDRTPQGEEEETSRWREDGSLEPDPMDPNWIHLGIQAQIRENLASELMWEVNKAAKITLASKREEGDLHWFFSRMVDIQEKADEALQRKETRDSLLGGYSQFGIVPGKKTPLPREGLNWGRVAEVKNRCVAGICYFFRINSPFIPSWEVGDSDGFAAAREAAGDETLRIRRELLEDYSNLPVERIKISPLPTYPDEKSEEDALYGAIHYQNWEVDCPICSEEELLSEEEGAEFPQVSGVRHLPLRKIAPGVFLKIPAAPLSEEEKVR